MVGYPAVLSESLNFGERMEMCMIGEIALLEADGQAYGME